MPLLPSSAAGSQLPSSAAAASHQLVTDETVEFEKQPVEIPSRLQEED